METPQPANFLGFTFDVWLGIVTAALALYACVVLARRKRRSFSELGDEEHEDVHPASGERPSFDADPPLATEEKTPRHPS